MRNSLSLPRQTTPERPVYTPLIDTPRTIRQITKFDFKLTTHPDIPEALRGSLLKFTRGEIAVARYDLLMEQRLETTIAAENARRSRKSEANKVLQKGGILYAENARHINKERLQLEIQRAKEREIV